MPEVLMLLLLAVWAGAIAVLVCVDRAEKFLWIPILLALAGVFSSMLPVAISPNAAAVTNGTLLTLFIVSFGALEKNRRPSIALLRRRAR